MSTTSSESAIEARVAAPAAEIVPFEPALRSHFYRLNADWLRRYFEIEDIDERVLSEPEREIIAPGGAILFARLDGAIVGTCALLHAGSGRYELSKMAVEERCRGAGLGRALLAAAIAEFERRGGRELFLESSSKLGPALRLYERMGFVRQPGPAPDSHYRRSDVYMIWSGRVPEAR